MLQHRTLLAAGEVVGREQQYGKPVDRGESRTRDHVRRTRPDRGRAGVGGQPSFRLGVGGGYVDHRLLAPGGEHRQQVRVLRQSLSQTLNVPVTEDAEHRRDKAATSAV